MKVVYWACRRLNDGSAYNIRAKTKTVAEKQRAEDPAAYGPPTKVIIEAKDAFDLVCQVLGEGGVEHHLPYPDDEIVEDENQLLGLP